MPDLLKILILAIVQGAAELLPVSSSAHVTVVARLIGYNLGAVPWLFMIVMLHTGTMFAVLVYFWRRWLALLPQAPVLIAATVLTCVIGLGISEGYKHATGKDIESQFQNLPLIAASLAAAGVLILVAGYKDLRRPATDQTPGMRRGLLIGLVQSACLPFRGFSRSGATISASMLLGVARMKAEEFSFALAVLLTPALIFHSGRKMLKANAGPEPVHLTTLLGPGLAGMALSFLAGLVALRLLSRWMEEGRWHWFGYYCLAAAAVVLAVHFST